MGTMVSSFDTYGMTEILFNLRLLLFVGDVFLLFITVLLCLLVIHQYKKPKPRQ